MQKLIAVLAVLSLPVFAQSGNSQQPKKVPVQQIDFGETDLIEGGRAVGLGEIYVVPTSPKFKSLIKIRMNFDDKLRESVHEM